MRISDWSSDVCSSDLLGERIVTQIQYAPPDFEQDLAAHLGSAFSLTPTLLQSTYFRGHNRDARIENLYFTGAGTHPGAGIPGVVASAKAPSRLILGAFRIRTAAARDPGARDPIFPGPDDPAGQDRQRA